MYLKLECIHLDGSASVLKGAQFACKSVPNQVVTADALQQRSEHSFGGAFSNQGIPLSSLLGSGRASAVPCSSSCIGGGGGPVAVKLASQTCSYQIRL